MVDISINITADYVNLDKEIEDTVRAFYPFIRLDSNAKKLIEIKVIKNEKDMIINLFSNFKSLSLNNAKTESELIISRTLATENNNALTLKKEIKTNSKLMVYDYLSEISGVKLPYGSLTGIRPTKLFYELSEKGLDAHKTLTDYYKVNENKANLIESVVNNQKGFYKKNIDKIDVFINIPVCISRCSYCSFISIERCKLPNGLLDKYVSLLIDEIKTMYSVLSHDKINTVYIGGGTPTSLDADQLSKTLEALSVKGKEFTVEAGRPDTIDEEKLKVFKDNNVTRLSINPQTFNDKTLSLIGRKHNSQDIYKALESARKYGFDINMDLIAMLPQETFDDFKYSLDKTIELEPDNITIHTLALKRGATLKNENYDNNENINLSEKMIDYSINKLTDNGYNPYYMYRLKNMSGGLENVGYAKKGKQCIYNIDIMEETHSIYAIGAGGISKRIKDDVLERYSASKDLYFYINNYDKIVKEKIKFFEKI